MPSIQTILPDESVVTVPAWVTDHPSFVRWISSDDAPDKGKISYLHGTVCIDKSMEQILHNLIKSAVSRAILQWNERHQLGHYYGDGMVYTNEEAEFTTVPDGIFVCQQSMSTGLVMADRGWRSTKLSGSPDLLVEVVSRSSVKKDLKELKELYFEAGVREYWMVDSRVDSPQLVIYVRNDHEFVETIAKQGWTNSPVLEAECQLIVDEIRQSIKLEMR
jgi:Uma2 family endonuclease